MNPIHCTVRAGLLLCSAALTLLAASTALADPPARVARLSHIDGTVSFAPAGEDEWAIAPPNRPFITGDRIWSDEGSRAELQLGTAAVRLGAATSVTVLNLDDRIGQFQLAQGTLNVYVRQLYRDQAYEIDTPNLAFSIRTPGDYRIDVDPSGDSTTVSVRRGEGEAYGEGAAYVISAQQSYRFTGTGLADYDFNPLPPPDAFDRWALERDRREDNARTARYVSPEVVGYSDLDEYGEWTTVPDYGPVWFPTRVQVGWAPYHYGHWAWVEPWGWTWIDDAPWGFAPFHYGRWAFFRERWCWVPGPRTVRPVYAPALVAFVGGGDFRLSISGGRPVTGVAWFPLGPREVYRPPYRVSREYFTSVNVSNTRVSTTTVTNIYNNQNVNIVYRNREIPNAVTAVPTSAFAEGRHVARAAVPVSPDTMVRARISPVAPVAPTRASLIAGAAVGAAAGAAAARAVRPPEAVLTRQAVARVAPPLPPAPFEARQRQLASQPGRPIEPGRAAPPSPGAAAVAPRVRVVQGAPQPAAAPPPRGEARGAARVPAGAPGAPPAANVAPPGAPGAQPPGAAPGAQPPAARGPAQREARPGQAVPPPPAAARGPQEREAGRPVPRPPETAAERGAAPRPPTVAPARPEIGQVPRPAQGEGEGRGPEGRGGPPSRPGPEAARPPSAAGAPSQARPPEVARPPATAAPPGAPEARREERVLPPRAPEAARPPLTAAPQPPQRPPEARREEHALPPPQSRAPEAARPPVTAAPQPSQRPPEARREERALPPPQSRAPEAARPPVTAAPQPPQRPPEARREERALPPQAAQPRPQPPVQAARPPEPAPQARPAPGPGPGAPAPAQAARPGPQGGEPPPHPERGQRPGRPGEKGEEPK